MLDEKVEKLRVHAVPLLLGCSSGQLARHGRSLDPLGTAQVCAQPKRKTLSRLFSKISSNLKNKKHISHPLGNTQNYLLASSPALLGFLWAVTDADVDQWTVVFLQVIWTLEKTK